MDVSGRAKIVTFEADQINQLFFGQVSTVGIEVPIDRELHVIPATNTFDIVVNSSTMTQDNGVFLTSGPSAGMGLVRVASAPAQGQYTVNVASQTYTFSALDNSQSVAISYTFADNTRGKTITITNQLMGYAPVIAMDVWNKFRNKVLGIRLNAVTVGNWTFPSKLEDFWISDMSFEANTDASDTLGKIFSDNF